MHQEGADTDPQGANRTMPDTKTPEAKAARLQEVSAQMARGTTEAEKLGAERIALMVELHDAGWSNVLIAAAAGGLTRQRVSMILRPALEQRVLTRGAE